MKIDLKALGEEIIGSVKGYVDKALSPFEARLKALEDRPVAKDGVGLAGAVIDRDGQLVLTLSDGKTVNLGLIVGKDGEQGPKGFDLDDFDVNLDDDGRTIELSFDSGEQRFTRQLQLPTMIYRGVFEQGRTYEVGDVVTWGGSSWACSARTEERPGEGAKGWTLSVKKGRDAAPVVTQ